jgi:hypothetical protein
MSRPGSMRIAILLLAIALVACRPAESQMSRQARLGTPVTLAPGERAVFPDERLEVQFVAVVSDSRCPSDATCVWAGEVLVRIATRSDSETEQHELTAGQGFEVGRYRATVVDVQPVPVSTRKIAPDEYRATLEVRASG